MLGGGIYLITLGGSWYYALVGGVMTWAAWRAFVGDIVGIWAYLGVFVFTLIWSIWEVGFSFWPLVPRLVAPMFLAAAALFLVPLFPASSSLRLDRRAFYIGGGVLSVGFLAFMTGMFFPQDVVRRAFDVVPGRVTGVTQASGTDWTAYGRTGEGNRFSPANQITRENVGQLEQVWAVHLGDIAEVSESKEDQNTPLYAGGKIYHCSPSSQVSAIDPATGTRLWFFNPQATSPFWLRCRGLGFVPARGPEDDCGDRIIVATVDRRMIALKAEDGEICRSFGNDGTVNLGAGIGDIPPGMLMPTTGPNVAGERIVIGGWVSDNVSEGEPSGVVRAFNAYSGALEWAWDLGNPAITALPPEGENYTRGTPNAWPPLAWDLELGLVYLPTGNATPDYYGGERRPFDDQYNSSVVALDLNTGRPRWHFQTVHHDLWDYDLPSQPALVDMPDGHGGTTPALIQTTKRGQIFVLDRRTGEPITEVEERPAPASDGTSTGERYSPTQPYSVGMPAIAAEPLSERRMWGATPLDQMLCRIKFRQTRYDGDFTTPSTRQSIQWPGNYGGFNWGSAAIDQERNLLIVNDIRMPLTTQLVPRDEIPAGTDFSQPHGGFSEQRGTPFAIRLGEFMSPIGFPCLAPPMGMITAIDLATRQVVWQIPAGTMGDLFGVPLYVGMPTMGGPMVTRGGLVFFAGTQDYFLRAMDVETGQILWQGRLPVGAQATPMTFVDETGRQFVVVNASGARDNTRDRGDYLVAFALPEPASSTAG